MSFERYTESVAHAEAALANAEEVRDAAAAERAAVQELVDAKSAEIRDLRSGLGDGTIDKADAAALARLLEQDLGDLAAVIAQHDTKVNESKSGVDRARASLEASNRALDSVIAQAEFNALQSHVKECEAMLLKGLTELAALAPRIGKANSAIHAFHSFGHDLSRAVANSVVPPRR